MSEYHRSKLVTIDFSNVKTISELHLEFKNVLDFPEFYGMNTDAFWDCISGMIELPYVLELKGWENIETNFPNDAKNLRDCFKRFNCEFSNWACEVRYIR